MPIMITRKTKLPGVMLLEPKVYADKRGYFFDSYDRKVFLRLGISADFVRDSETFSKKGAIRGLHYQLSPYAQAKLIRVVQGKVIDVVVDLRRCSPTFGKWERVELSEHNKRLLFVPEGFAHGYLAVSDTAILLYKFTNKYSPQHQRGIVYNDPILNIDWGWAGKKVTVSQKDSCLPRFEHAQMNFKYTKNQ